MDNRNTNAENIGESGNAAKLPVSGSGHSCTFVEEYYGHRCSGCGVFYPHGGAPWDPYCANCLAVFPEECCCEDNEGWGGFSDEDE